MNQMCLDCTAFDADQGMYAHPLFHTEYDWLMHLHQSHGKPKPEPQHDGDKPKG